MTNQAVRPHWWGWKESIAVAIVVAVAGGTAALLIQDPSTTDGHSTIELPIYSSARTRAQDRAAQSDLRNGMTAEKTVYTDNQTYDASPTNLKNIEMSLDWGGKLTVVVGDAMDHGDRGTVCLSETSASGTTFSIGDVSAGPSAGTYYGKSACPNFITSTYIASLETSWDPVTQTTQPPSVRNAQDDLRNGLTAEKVYYTDNEAYIDSATKANVATLKSIEGSLDWGKTLNAVVGDAVSAGDKGVVCLSETDTSGAAYSLGDVSAGANAGTYYGRVACPAAPTPANVAALGTSW